ncbi:MAG: hypothetical protein ABEK50_09755 [bacterium]
MKLFEDIDLKVRTTQGSIIVFFAVEAERHLLGKISEFPRFDMNKGIPLLAKVVFVDGKGVHLEEQQYNQKNGKK